MLRQSAVRIRCLAFRFRCCRSGVGRHLFGTSFPWSLQAHVWHVACRVRHVLRLLCPHSLWLVHPCAFRTRHFICRCGIPCLEGRALLGMLRLTPCAVEAHLASENSPLPELSLLGAPHSRSCVWRLLVYLESILWLPACGPFCFARDARACLTVLQCRSIPCTPCGVQFLVVDAVWRLLVPSRLCASCGTPLLVRGIEHSIVLIWRAAVLSGRCSSFSTNMALTRHDAWKTCLDCAGRVGPIPRQLWMPRDAFNDSPQHRKMQQSFP